MAVPTTRETFKTYCLRRLGQGVIDINVDDNQLEDRIDDAIEFFQEYHFDGVEKAFISHQITAEDLTNKYLSISDSVIGITRLAYGSGSSTSMFDVQYQMRLNDYLGSYGSLTASSEMQNYWMTMSNISMIEDFFNHEPTLRFNRVVNKLYIDWNWTSDVAKDTWIVLEGYTTVSPGTYAEVWGNRLLRDYCTALFKEQWGMNLSKYDGVQLPGGTTLNGRAILEDAKADIAQIKETASLQYELPLDFYTG